MNTAITTAFFMSGVGRRETDPSTRDALRIVIVEMYIATNAKGAAVCKVDRKGTCSV